MYASTEEILWKALIDTDLFDELREGNYEDIPLHNGDILNIHPDGNLKYYKFNYRDTCGYRFRDWWDFGTYLNSDKTTDSYIYELKSVASYMGVSPDDVDELLKNGFSPEEVEDYIYCM